MTPPGQTLPARELALDDPCLVGCREGRADAIEEFFRSHSAMVERLIARLIGPSADLEDLVQSTFVEVLANLSRFRGEAKLSTWICGIAVHIAHHHLRAGKVRRHVSLELVSDEHPRLVGVFVDTRVSADHGIDARRLASRLHSVLDRIGPKKRIALLLYVLEEKSVEEIAALMKATQTATRSRMYFARRELRKLVAADSELKDWAAGLMRLSVEGRA
jgi:RNA polymerase sigma-70 factor (ECF subfamily)